MRYCTLLKLFAFIDFKRSHSIDSNTFVGASQKKQLQTIDIRRFENCEEWASQTMPPVSRCFLRISKPAPLEGNFGLRISSEVASRITNALATALLSGSLGDISPPRDKIDLFMILEFLILHSFFFLAEVLKLLF